jgi:hypothetical protein
MMHTIQILSDDDKAQLNAAAEKAIALGLSTELCGSWLWVSGDTKSNRQELKVYGFKYAPKKQLWFFRPTSQKSFSRGNWEIDRIRQVHGTQRV